MLPDELDVRLRVEAGRRGRVIADGDHAADPVLASEWGRVAELVERYSNLQLGMVDASVVALAERHGAEVVATLDRRPSAPFARVISGC